MMRVIISLNFMNIKATLLQHGSAYAGTMEPTGHAQAQSLQDFAISASSVMCANFREFSSLPSP